MRNGNYRGLLIVLVVLVLIALLAPLISGGVMGRGGVMGGAGGMMPQGQQGMLPQGGVVGGWAWGLAMGLGALSTLAFWGALIVGIILVVRWSAARDAHPDERSGVDPALETLRRRYAAGEISQEEY
jgi:uncharacterized membrane protein